MRVGSLVECIDDQNIHFQNLRNWGNTTPVKGVIYTVRWIGKSAFEPEPVLRVEEIINDPQEFTYETAECAFMQQYFRELAPPQRILISDLIEETLKELV